MPNNDHETEQRPRKRTRILRPYPVQTLEEALAIAAAIHERNAGRPFERVLLARALGTTAKSSTFTQKLNASQSYGITEGGYADEEISLTQLGESIVAPRLGDERPEALVKAALKPEIFERFYQLVNGKKLPEDTFAKNVLKRELGLESSLTGECLDLLKSNGLYVGILKEHDGKFEVALPGQPSTPPPSTNGPVNQTEPEPAQGAAPEPDEAPEAPARVSRARSGIYVCHAGNPEVADHVQEVLEPFGVPHTIAECDFDATRPIGSEAAEMMRGCDAAIFVFADPTDEKWSGRRPEKRNEKMMYQLGAASVLYDDRIVVLAQAGVETGPSLPSFRTLEFEPDRIDTIGLKLFQELHKIGVIEVTV